MQLNWCESIFAEKIEVSSTMAEKISKSQFKYVLKNRGRKFTAYIYAEDEVSEQVDRFSCINGEELHEISKTGSYYIYLYDEEEKKFLPVRKQIFAMSREVTLNIEGADIKVVTNPIDNDSNILLISQFVACSANDYEAYGFSKNTSSLQNYQFTYKKKKFMQLGGRVIDQDKKNDFYVVIENGSYREYPIKITSKEQ